MAMEQEVEPIRRDVAQLRATWLTSLMLAVPAPFLALGKALSVTSEEFGDFASEVASQLHRSKRAIRSDADFAAAFGCEVCFDRSKRLITPTEFQLIAGSGHQYFLETLGRLMECVTEDQIGRAIFGPWTFQDSRLSFRWYPGDDRRYGYRWENPSSNEKETGVPSEHGANLLAAFGLPMFPVIPTRSGAVTTGFGLNGKAVEFTWPIWNDFRSCDAVRSLLASTYLLGDKIERENLCHLGVVDAYRSRKIEVGKSPNSKFNMTPAVSV